MIFIDTTPLELTTFRQHNKIRAYIRIHAEKKKRAPADWYEYNIDLTEYYNYCKLQDINIQHSLDRVGDDRTNYRCGVTFYFDSYADKACFVLKFM